MRLMDQISNDGEIELEWNDLMYYESFRNVRYFWCILELLECEHRHRSDSDQP